MVWTSHTNWGTECGGTCGVCADYRFFFFFFITTAVATVIIFLLFLKKSFDKEKKKNVNQKIF